MSKLTETLREPRQWLGELRRWALLARPVLGNALRKGRHQAKARPASPAADAIAALCALGLKKRVAAIAVREAQAELGDAGSEALIQDALRRVR